MSRQEELGDGAGTEDRKHERSCVRSVRTNLPSERETRGERNHRVREGRGIEGKKGDGGKHTQTDRGKRDTSGTDGSKEEMRTEAEVEQGPREIQSWVCLLVKGRTFSVGQSPPPMSLA